MNTRMRFPGSASVNAVALAGSMLLVSHWATAEGESVAAQLHSSGVVKVVQAGKQVAVVELSAHGPGWKHVSQYAATATVSDLPGKKGKLFNGTLPVPGTEGAAFKFTERVQVQSQALLLDYQLLVTKTMRVNGLQFAVTLPVSQFGGKELLVSRIGDDQPTLVGLPKEKQEGKKTLWTGPGDTIEVAKGTGEAIGIELRAATDVTIQDLRQWDTPAYEIRFPGIMEDAGRELTTRDRFHLNITITVTSPVKLEGPWPKAK